MLCHTSEDSPPYAVNSGGTTILSPSFPNKYPTNCDNELTIFMESIIILNFEFFDIEPSENCDDDWFEVRDGSISTDKQIGGNMCGSELPKAIISSGNFLTLRFKSSHSKSYSGFKIKAESGKFLFKIY